MRKLIPIFAVALVAFFASDINAQGKKKSPAASVSGSIDGVEIKIDYHQPSARGRDIMGDLVPFDEVWRTGANNATTIEFSDEVEVEGESLSAGKYSLFTIPGEDEWVIIFNSVDKQWGAYDYDESKDVLRVKVEPGSTDSFVETFEIDVTDTHVTMAWENTMVKFEVSK